MRMHNYTSGKSEHKFVHTDKMPTFQVSATAFPFTRIVDLFRNPTDECVTTLTPEN